MHHSPATSSAPYALTRDDEFDDHELPLMADDISLDDPLDEKDSAGIGANSYLRGPVTATSKHWASFTQRFAWLRRSDKSHDQDGFDYTETKTVQQNVGLLHNDWNSRIQEATDKSTMSWFIWPLPSWTHRFFGHRWPDEPQRPTDYLDGLRGVSSFFVFNDHYLLAGSADIVNYSYGADNHWNILQLPFIRTVFSGAAMVSIFFVISGYVLSARCIVAVRSGNPGRAHNAITSMTFRRPIRLFLPSIAASGLSLFGTFMGIRASHWPRHWSTWKELKHYGVYLDRELFRVWNWDEELDRLFGPDWNGWYGGQLWTIPREFNCSMILFLLLIATARCRVWVRFAIEAILIVYLFSEGRWDVATFVAGMATAELNIIAAERRQAREDAGLPVKRSLRSRLLRDLPLWAAFIFGWYLTGMPYLGHEHTPGYSFLTEYWVNNATVKYRFWLAIAAILLTGSLSFLPYAQRFFTTSVARYLGKISYSLYLIHPFMNSTLRKAIWGAFGVLDGVGPHNNSLSWKWAAATLCYLPCLFWAADVFWRLVDAPAVRLAKWVEQKCFEPQE